MFCRFGNTTIVSDIKWYPVSLPLQLYAYVQSFWKYNYC